MSAKCYFCKLLNRYQRKSVRMTRMFHENEKEGENFLQYKKTQQSPVFFVARRTHLLHVNMWKQKVKWKFNIKLQRHSSSSAIYFGSGWKYEKVENSLKVWSSKKLNMFGSIERPRFLTVFMIIFHET